MFYFNRPLKPLANAGPTKSISWRVELYIVLTTYIFAQVTTLKICICMLLQTKAMTIAPNNGAIPSTRCDKLGLI